MSSDASSECFGSVYLVFVCVFFFYEAYVLLNEKKTTTTTSATKNEKLEQIETFFFKPPAVPRKQGLTGPPGKYGK